MLKIEIKKLLALIVIAGFFAILTTLLFSSNIPKDNLDLVKTMVIALISLVSAIIGYYFGSSDGSFRKTELMAPLPPIVGVDLASKPDETVTALVTKERGSIRLPLLLALVMLAAMLLTLSGCAATNSAQIREDVATGLQVADGATDVAMALCKDGTLPADSCAAIAAGNLAVDIIEQLIDPHVEWVE